LHKRIKFSTPQWHPHGNKNLRRKSTIKSKYQSQTWRTRS
jgi:hypothetical protein